MELNQKMYERTNSVIDSIGFDDNKSSSVSKVLHRLNSITDQLTNDKRLETLEKYDFYNIATQLRDIKNTINVMDRAGVLSNKEKEDDLIDRANTRLANYLKKENLGEISLKTLAENFFNTWNKVFLEVLDLVNYKFTPEKEWWQHLTTLLLGLLTILTKEDRLIYVGIGMCVASFFIYFILVSK